MEAQTGALARLGAALAAVRWAAAGRASRWPWPWHRPCRRGLATWPRALEALPRTTPAGQRRLGS